MASTIHYGQVRSSVSFIRLTLTKYVDVRATVCREIEGQDGINTNREAVDYLLISLATDKVITKAATEIDSFKKFPNQTAVQFFEALKAKGHGTSLWRHILLTAQNEIFGESLPLNVRDSIHMY